MERNRWLWGPGGLDGTSWKWCYVENRLALKDSIYCKENYVPITLKHFRLEAPSQCTFFFLVCIDIQFNVMYIGLWEAISWSLGPCSSSQAYTSRSTRTFVERCCIVPGRYMLLCQSPRSGYVGYLDIEGHKFCNNFVGFEEMDIVSVLSRYIWLTFENCILMKMCLYQSGSIQNLFILLSIHVFS